MQSMLSIQRVHVSHTDVPAAVCTNDISAQDAGTPNTVPIHFIGSFGATVHMQRDEEAMQIASPLGS